MPELYVGVMSGTSLDGVDAVLADLTAAPRLIHARHDPLPPDLRDALVALNSPGPDELRRAAVAANALARLYSDSVRALLTEQNIAPGGVSAVGCHGQTVRHDPAAGYTVQLVNAALLAELTSISVACDFRSRDIAAGGEGAPLVPAFHHAVFHAPNADRVVVNVGGIANITHLPRDGSVSGFDCGPGNVVLDAWVRRTLGDPYDDRGAWGRQGGVLPELLERLRAHPFFARQPPKSTGREHFNLDWLQSGLRGDEAPVDVQATLTEVTATGIADAVDTHCAGATAVYLCGGGARNDFLTERLRALLPACSVGITDELGLDAEWVEALAFAWLAQRTVRTEAGNVPAVTGARGARVLGAIYPR